VSLSVDGERGGPLDVDEEMGRWYYHVSVYEVTLSLWRSGTPQQSKCAPWDASAIDSTDGCPFLSPCVQQFVDVCKIASRRPLSSRSDQVKSLCKLQLAGGQECGPQEEPTERREDC
jgi:hypothetical protein